MKIGPRYKIGKRLGASVFEKCQTQKFMLSEARSKKRRGKRPRMISDFGKQLLEKQKVRYTYGITEKQLSQYVKQSSGTAADSTNKVYQMLELRLDNVVYRLGLAPTRRFARQLVSHGHVLVNGKRVTIPSFQTKVGEAISVRPSSKEKGMFLDLPERLKNHSPASWIILNEKEMEGSITSLPEFSSTGTELDLGLVLEYYSR